MGRPKGGTNISHSKEEKLVLVKRNLAGESLMALERETGIYNAQIHKWAKQYLEGGEAALVNKRKPGNPLAKYERRKCDDIHKVVADTIHYFNCIRPVRKLKRKPPVQYRLELAA